MASSRRRLPFFALTFAITWGLQIPGVLAQHGWLPGNPRHYLPFAGLGIFGPFVAALVLTQREAGAPGVKSLFARMVRWRAAPRYYIAAVAPAALLSALLSVLDLSGRHGPIAYLPTAGGTLAGLVISSTEELGWRGFALPRLEERWGGFAASGILGAVWYAWHLPMFIGQGVPTSLVLVMLLYFWGASLLLSWLSAGTRGSLLFPILAHFATHLNNSFRALPLEVVPLVAHAMVYGALGFALMRTAARARFTPSPETTR